MGSLKFHPSLTGKGGLMPFLFICLLVLCILLPILMLLNVFYVLCGATPFRLFAYVKCPPFSFFFYDENIQLEPNFEKVLTTQIKEKNKQTDKKQKQTNKQTKTKTKENNKWCRWQRNRSRLLVAEQCLYYGVHTMSNITERWMCLYHVNKKMLISILLFTAKLQF